MDTISTAKSPAPEQLEEIELATKPGLKVDKHGLPLAPQPSDSPADPLNWPYWRKLYIVLLVSFLSFIAQVSGSMYNPALQLISKSLHVTIEQASYCTTVYILFGGCLSMFVVPYANVYGRRICYVIFTVLAAAGAFVSAAAPTYGGVIVGRVLNGIGSSVPLGIGAATICDLFTQGERGVYMGIYTVSVTNGPHVSPIAGGYIAARLGWRWCFWVPGIIQAGLWVLVLFTLPETLFSRYEHSQLENTSYLHKMLFHGKVLDRKVRPRDFVGSLRMARYWAVLLPCIWYMTNNAYGSTLFAVTGANLGAKIYKFKVEQIGLFLGVPLTVGCFIGEATAGWVSDKITTFDAKRRGTSRRAEARLYLLPACTLLGLGTALYGFCIEHRRPWIESCVCMAISGFGSQVGTTMIYTYATDAYKPQSGEIGAVINFFKSIFAFNIAFYALPFGESAGFSTAFGVLGGINLVLLIPLVVLCFRGEEIRLRQGEPLDHTDI